MALYGKPVKFTPLARQQLQDITSYLHNEFGPKTVEKLLEALEQKLQFIAQGKLLNRFFYKPKQIRYFILNRKNYVLYQELKTSIEILGIYGALQDMNEVKKKFG